MVRSRVLLAVLVLAAGAVLTTLVPRAGLPPTAGMLRSTEIRIAPEVSGRLLSLPVASGDIVRAGAVLARIDNPELAASLLEARAVAASARAERDRVYAGVRQEQVEILEREVQKAQSNLTLAQQGYARTASLAANQNASRQALDKAAADVGAMQSALAATQSQLARGQGRGRSPKTAGLPMPGSALPKPP